MKNFLKKAARWIPLAIVLSIIYFVMTFEAPAQTACLPHGKLVELLDNRYSEQRIAVGLESNGRLFEIFATDDSSTWTMVVTTPDGAACVVAAGLDWQVDAPLPADESSY